MRLACKHFLHTVYGGGGLLQKAESIVPVDALATKRARSTIKVGQILRADIRSDFANIQCSYQGS